MDMLKKYLALGVILLVGSASAMDDVLQPQFDGQDRGYFAIDNPSAAWASSPELQEFKKLVKDVLRAEKPSTGKRLGVGVAREMLRVAGMLSLSCPNWIYNTFNKVPESSGWKVQLKENSRFIELGVFVLAILLADVLISKKDQSLVALQKLQKFVSSLTPDKKEQIAELFKHEYAEELRDKVQKDKDGTGLKSGKGLVAVFDLMIPLFLACKALGVCGLHLNASFLKELCEKTGKKLVNLSELSEWKKANSNPEFIAILLVAILDGGLVLKNAINSADRQKNDALQKIEAALK